MRKAELCVLLVLVCVPGSLSAKGITARIVVTGGGLRGPLEISEPAILERFSVWAGRGTRVNGLEGSEGFIIDWPAGTLRDAPGRGHRFEVAFHVKYWNRALQQYGPDEKLAYVVTYDFDPSRADDYVYLPGRSDKAYGLNTSAILRGCEGNWFRASRAWQEVIKPLISNARK